MSKSISLSALLAIAVCWPAPANAEIYPELQTWLDGFTDKTHKWVECPKDATQATAANPWFKWNPRTDDPKFDCKQVGPHSETKASWPGTEGWWIQHARFLRVKECVNYPVCSVDNGECTTAKDCKIEAVRACSPAYVGKPGDSDPFGKDGISKNGCVIIGPRKRRRSDQTCRPGNSLRMTFNPEPGLRDHGMPHPEMWRSGSR